MADKLDSIAGLWSAGLKPTGAKDPYAVRQAAIGILRTLFGRKLSLSLRDWIVKALAPYAPASPEPLVDEIADYFLERQRALFVRDGAPADVVEAVLCLKYDDPVENAARVKALFTMIHDAEFVRFFDLAKRVRKIAPHERQVAPGGGYGYPGLRQVDEARLVHPLEKRLWEEFAACESECALLVEQKDWLQILHVQKRLIGPVDQFFNEGPKVLAPEADLKENRTTLCARLDRFLCSVADLSAVTAAPKAEGAARAAEAR